jgi:hypothetical protein
MLDFLMFDYTGEIDFSLHSLLLDRVCQFVDAARQDMTKVPMVGDDYRSDYVEIGKMLQYGYVDNPYCDQDTFNKIKDNVATLTDQAKVHALPVPDILKKLIVNQLPASLRKLNPNVVIQIVTGGTHIQAHWDHNERTSSMFFLLESDDADTIWYEPKETINLHDKFRLVYDLSQLEEKKRICFDLNRWYVFTHNQCHAVYRHYPSRSRVALCIEFVDLPAKELYNTFVL